MHVTAGWRQEKEMGFVETGPSEDSAQNTRVLALDCEMVCCSSFSGVCVGHWEGGGGTGEGGGGTGEGRLYL